MDNKHIRIECPAPRKHRIKVGEFLGEVPECKRLLTLTDPRNQIVGQYIKCPMCGAMIYISQNSDDGITLKILDKSERIVCKQSIKGIE